jgi:hypothetical protein
VNRRRFLGALVALLPVPAFVKASSLWLPPERPRVQPLTFETIERAMARAAAQGFPGINTATAYLTPEAWAACMEDLEALKRHAVSPEGSKEPVQGLALYCVSGKVEIKASPYVRDGEVYLAPFSSIFDSLGPLPLVGAADPSHDRGQRGGMARRELQRSLRGGPLTPREPRVRGGLLQPRPGVLDLPAEIAGGHDRAGC